MTKRNAWKIFYRPKPLWIIGYVAILLVTVLMNLIADEPPAPASPAAPSTPASTPSTPSLLDSSPGAAASGSGTPDNSQTPSFPLTPNNTDPR